MRRRARAAFEHVRVAVVAGLDHVVAGAALEPVGAGTAFDPHFDLRGDAFRDRDLVVAAAGVDQDRAHVGVADGVAGDRVAFLHVGGGEGVARV